MSWLDDLFGGSSGGGGGDSLGVGGAGDALTGAASSGRGSFEGGASSADQAAYENQLMSAMNSGAGAQSRALYGDEDTFTPTPTLSRENKSTLYNRTADPSSYGAETNQTGTAEKALYGKGGIVGQPSSSDLAEPKQQADALGTTMPFEQALRQPTAEAVPPTFLDQVYDRFKRVKGGLSTGLDKLDEYGVDLQGNQFDAGKFATAATGSEGLGNVIGAADNLIAQPGPEPNVSPLNLPPLPADTRPGLIRSKAPDELEQRRQYLKIMRQLAQR